MLLGLGGAGLLTGFHLYFPGQLSGMQTKHEPIDGFVSHADFEQECGHCHAPLHCVTDTRCQDCHIEVARQRASATGLHSRLPGTGRCQNCHVEHQGRQAVITTFAFNNVDHARLSGFSLDHHHQDYEGEGLHCTSCHTQDSYVAETLDCITCHTNEDHAYMAQHIEDFGIDCLACHDGRDRMADFDHNQVYTLDGVHAQTDCSECHADFVYAGTPRECASCHEEPTVHLGVFGLDCSRCHTAQAWNPAMLVRHNFPLDHASDSELECSLCHISTYVEHDCYQCHDHQVDQIQEVHAAEGIEAFENCVECHPSGRKTGQEKLDGQDPELERKVNPDDLHTTMLDIAAGQNHQNIP